MSGRFDLPVDRQGLIERFELGEGHMQPIEANGDIRKGERPVGSREAV